MEKIVRKGEIACYKQFLILTSNFSFSHNVFYPVWHLFLAPLASELMSWSIVRCASVWPSVRPSICALTFSLNIFFSETTYQTSMKFHRNVPGIVLFRIS